MKIDILLATLQVFCQKLACLSAASLETTQINALGMLMGPKTSEPLSIGCLQIFHSFFANHSSKRCYSGSTSSKFSLDFFLQGLQAVSPLQETFIFERFDIF